MVTDAFGVNAEVGMRVAYASGGRGAQPFTVGEIVSIGPKTVRIKVIKTSIDLWGRSPVESIEHYQRPNGAFVVQL